MDDDEGYEHIVPIDDMREHTLTFDCWCNPYYEDGVFVHNSMDCREIFDEGNEDMREYLTYQ